MNSDKKNQKYSMKITLGTLLGCGALLGLSTNLAKVASNQNLSALPFLTWSLLGATFILTIISALKNQKIPKSKVAIKYYFSAAFFSVAGSNLIFFSAIPHVGVSFVALTISLPPLLTYFIALSIGLEKFCRWRAMGVIFSLIGTSILVAAKWSSPESDHTWILITLLGPILLAAGNIYRTTHWPSGEKPETLAPGMLIAATTTLVLVSLIVPEWSLSLQLKQENLALIFMQSIVFAGQFLLLFILQKVGGPVLLSLIGAVSAIFGIPFAMTLLNEPMLPALLPSALLIAVGIACMMKQQLTKRNAVL
jgi:drug/metabolite transporter (DMT)-like permease